MSSEADIVDLPLHIGVEVEYLVALVEQERKIREEVARQRDLVLSLLTRPDMASLRRVVTQRHVVSVEKASPHRRLRWGMLENLFHDAYEFLLQNNVIQIIQPNKEWKLVVRTKGKRKGDDREDE